MDFKLEVVVVPVSDVDRAKRFYSEQLGFAVDVDQATGDAFRVVQLTPPGSACSITIGKGLVESAPGSLQGMQLVVSDIEAARDLLRAGRGCHAHPPVRRRLGRRQGRPVELVLLLQRSRRQRLDGPGKAGRRMTAEIDAYLANIPDDMREALEALRQQIRSAAPEAVEAMSYGAPAFRYRDRPLVAYGAARSHCSFYVMVRP